jgi:hypothetical protein
VCVHIDCSKHLFFSFFFVFGGDPPSPPFLSRILDPPGGRVNLFFAFFYFFFADGGKKNARRAFFGVFCPYFAFLPNMALLHARFLFFAHRPVFGALNGILAVNSTRRANWLAGCQKKHRLRAFTRSAVRSTHTRSPRFSSSTGRFLSI